MTFFTGGWLSAKNAVTKCLTHNVLTVTKIKRHTKEFKKKWLDEKCSTCSRKEHRSLNLKRKKVTEKAKKTADEENNLFHSTIIDNDEKLVPEKNRRRRKWISQMMWWWSSLKKWTTLKVWESLQNHLLCSIQFSTDKKAWLGQLFLIKSQEKLGEWAMKA